MKRHQKLVSWLLVFSMLIMMCACNSTSGKREKRSEESKPEHKGRQTETTETTEPTPTDTPTPTGIPKEYNDDEIIDLTMFSFENVSKPNDGNDIQKLIARKTGVRLQEKGMKDYSGTEEEILSQMESTQSIPDFVDFGTYNAKLYEKGLLVAWDEYLDKYPNLKAMYTDEEWERFRERDGKIYWVNCDPPAFGKDTSTTYTGQAFWIQVRVLEAYGYPKIETLDQYFDILEKYAKDHPTMPDGSSVIPYTCLCEGWKYYCIEQPPMYLDGFPNNGSVNVSIADGADKPKVSDFNVSETARYYFKKLNEEYKKGIVDPDFADQSYDDYIKKLCTGRVLGLCDQYWNFGYSIIYDFEEQKTANKKTYSLKEMGCEYVPLGLVAKAGTKHYWNSSYRGDSINNMSGIAVTTSCKDPDRAFKFLNDLLDPEVHNLRFWGIEGEDYEVDSNGLFYRTDKMRKQWLDKAYQAQHICSYGKMPKLKGIAKDGINCLQATEQPSEYMATLSVPVANCFKAYGVSTFTEFIGSEEFKVYPSFPMWTWSNGLMADTPVGKVFQDMAKCKHKWYPELVKNKDFNKAWSSYLTEYSNCKPDVFIKAAQTEADARVEKAKMAGWNP